MASPDYGPPADVQYDGSTRRVTWAHGDKGVALDNVIAVTRVKAHAPHYSLLYTIETPSAKNDPSASPWTFKSLFCSDVPETLLDDLKPIQDAFWSTLEETARVDKPTLHVIVSTGSGTGQARSMWELLLKPLLDHLSLTEGNDYKLHITSSESTVTEVTRDILLPEANRGVQQRVILLSGDGGMVDMLNALTATQQSSTYKKPVVALMPLGTGNALANSSGLTGDNTVGLRTIWSGPAQDVPIFRATFSPGARFLVNEARDERELHSINGTPTVHGAVVCSWAFHAALVADSDSAEYRKIGAERFKVAAKENLYPSDGSPTHAYHGKVSILPPGGRDWQAIDREDHGYVLATFCSHLEKGFNISPKSTPLDHQLRLIHFGPLRPDEAMTAMMKAYDGGKHVSDANIQYDDIDGMKIEFHEDEARWRRICLDGKIIRVEKDGWVEVRTGVKGVVDLIAKSS